jgi:hypothetical protein
MKSPYRVRSWTPLLLATVLCWPMTAGFAQQRSNAKPSPNQQAQTIKNPNRQAVRSQIKAAAAARAQSDPVYRVYLNAVNAHENQVKAFVQARKSDAR